MSGQLCKGWYVCNMSGHANRVGGPEHPRHPLLLSHLPFTWRRHREATLTAAPPHYVAPTAVLMYLGQHAWRERKEACASVYVCVCVCMCFSRLRESPEPSSKKKHNLLHERVTQSCVEETDTRSFFFFVFFNRLKKKKKSKCLPKFHSDLKNACAKKKPKKCHNTYGRKLVVIFRCGQRKHITGVTAAAGLRECNTLAWRTPPPECICSLQQWLWLVSLFTEPLWTVGKNCKRRKSLKEKDTSKFMNCSRISDDTEEPPFAAHIQQSACRIVI